MTEPTALALPAQVDLAALFKQPEGMEAIIAKLEQAARDEARGLSIDTAKGRDAIKSLAYKVSQSKAELDRQGKALTEQQRKEIDAVNAGRSLATRRLDALRDEIRKPVTDWEAKEEARIDAAKLTLAACRDHGMTGIETSDEIRQRAEQIKAIECRAEWAEYADMIEAARTSSIDALRAMYAAAVRREEEARELEALRAEKAAREAAEAERMEQELVAREAKEAEERAERERQEAEKRRAEQAARVEREKAEAAARAKAEAEARAKAEAERIKREAAEAAERAAKEAADREAALIRERDEAAQRERDRIEAERKAEADAKAKREADAAHRDRIKAAIVGALAAMRGNASPGQIADALMAGQIPHCKVEI